MAKAGSSAIDDGPGEQKGQGVEIYWLIAALFFILVPLAVAPPGVRPPIVVAILFPAIVFGVVTIVRYVREKN